MAQRANNRALHWFALVTAFAALLLIGVGGLVTSHEAGMAVPDWPTSYGYNMFLFPFSKWVGGIFYEHSHRLFASGVGLLTTLLAIWLWIQESRRWLRWLGALAFGLVVLQGVLGGLRVVLFKNSLGIFHATLAQLFLVLLAFIALFTSRFWLRLNETAFAANNSGFSVRPGARFLSIAGTVFVFVQLMLGATMRHQHAGLAVPDFPLAYGKIWPRTDPASLEAINQHRSNSELVTAFQIRLHMAHRLLALIIVCVIAGSTWLLRRSRPSHLIHTASLPGSTRSSPSPRPSPLGRGRIVGRHAARLASTAASSAGEFHPLPLGGERQGEGEEAGPDMSGQTERTCRLEHQYLTWLSGGWLGLVLLQATLGALTVWSNKAADIATLHVVVGAMSLVLGSIVTLLVWQRDLRRRRVAEFAAALPNETLAGWQPAIQQLGQAALQRSK